MKEPLTPSDSLEKLLDRENTSENQQTTTKEFIETIFKEWFTNDNIDLRTYLSVMNESGIIQGLTLNKFLEDNFGFRNEILDELIKEKIRKAKSIDGKSTTHLIEFVKSMGVHVENQQSVESPLGRFMR